MTRGSKAADTPCARRATPPKVKGRSAVVETNATVLSSAARGEGDLDGYARDDRVRDRAKAHRRNGIEARQRFGALRHDQLAVRAEQAHRLPGEDLRHEPLGRDGGVNDELHRASRSARRSSALSVAWRGADRWRSRARRIRSTAGARDSDVSTTILLPIRRRARVLEVPDPNILPLRASNMRAPKVWQLPWKSCHQVVAPREHVGRHQVGYDPSDLSSGSRRYVECVEQRLQLPDGKEGPTQFSKLSGISPVSAQHSTSARVSGTSSPRSAASKQARTCASISAGRSATTGAGAWG
jgi:hypothetical protein